LAAWVDIEFLIYRKLDKFNSQISKTVKKITFNLSLESMIIPRYLNFENNLDFFFTGNKNVWISCRVGGFAKKTYQLFWKDLTEGYSGLTSL